jgi:hypothetical protein
MRERKWQSKPPRCSQVRGRDRQARQYDLLDESETAMAVSLEAEKD